MSNESKSSGGGGVGCLGILAAAVLIAMGLWAYGFDAREAVGYGVAGAFGIFCGLPTLVVVVLFIVAGIFLVIGEIEKWHRRRAILIDELENLGPFLNSRER